MKIKFVNHASFMIESDDINIICDPWIEGPAFNKGWKLLSKSKIEYSEFDRITHIWFSHEHPDHFSPPNLLKIPKESRAKITVLFQETTDHKVAAFCRSIGFKDIVELKENVFYELSHQFSILCNPYTEGDSYALFKIGDFKILNLNDCVVSTEQKASDLKNKIGEVDLLFTQFGYADKVGNEHETTLREKASNEKLKRISIQNQYLKPKIIVPFASFIYFCHEENKYMNNGVKTIDVVADYIQNEIKTDCMVMYPGDEWQEHQNWNSELAIKQYLKDYSEIPSKTFETTISISEKVLIENSQLFLKTLKKAYANKTRIINSLSSTIFVTDYQKAYLLSGHKGLETSDLSSENCDVILSSESLNDCFRELWGFDTLSVNARFQTQKDYSKFRHFGEIAASLNRKENFPISSLLERVILRLKRLFQ